MSERHYDEAVDFNEVVNHESSIIHMFHEFQEELDMRHDKYERLAKLSRNITIESKRVIFLLHRIDGYELQSLISEISHYGIIVIAHLCFIMETIVESSTILL